MKNFRLKFVLASLLLVGGILSASAQQIGGVVKDTYGNPVIGATVIVEGTTLGTSSDLNGEWTLNVPNAADKTLEFSFIGMKTQTIAIGSQTHFDVTLDDESTAMEDVVVIGYATVNRRDVVGSVSSVSAETLAQMPVASVTEAMSGRMAGVSVTTAEGDPDADVKIRVRGTGSITQDSSPLYIVDGFPVESISDIPASDIQSIDVLKDAFSTAIYGSRGANGVVLVTTKGGNNDRITVSYNGYVGIKNIANKGALKVQDVNDFVRTQYEYAVIRNSMSQYTDYYGTWDDIDLYQGMVGTDWVDQLFGRTGVANDHNVSVNGGGKNFKWSASYAHHDEKAIMMLSDYKRDNLAFKSSYSPNKRVTLDVNVRYSNTRVRGSGANALNDAKTGTSRLGNAIQYSPLPVISVFDDSDTEEDYNVTVKPDTSVYDNDKKRDRVNWNANGAFTWEIIDNLKLRVEGGLDDYRNIDNSFMGITSYYARNDAADGFKDMPIARYQDETRKRIRNTNTLQYNFKCLLPKDHSLDLLIGQEYMVTNKNAVLAESQGLPEFFDAEMAWKFMSSGQFYKAGSVTYSDQDRLFSFFGRVNYDYKGKYSLSATMRADGSSKFARGNRWGYFPSVAAAWRISGEEFMAGTENWLDNLKLRYSFGTAGNNEIPSGQVTTQFAPSSSGNTNSGFGMVEWTSGNYMTNPDLKWETTWSHNIGLDFSFWNSRLSGSVELYQSNTKDLLIDFPVTGSGYTNQYRNLGEVRNRGIEVSLNAAIVRKQKWGIDFSGNIAFNQNRVMDLGGLDVIEARSNVFSTQTSWADYRVTVGRPIGDVYGLVNNGVYTVDDFDIDVYNTTHRWVLKDGVATTEGISSYVYPGAPKFVDQNDDKVINEADAVLLGNVQPLFTGGFSLSAYFYGFDFNANFTYSYGNKVYNANKIGFSVTQQRRNVNVLDFMGPDKRWSLVNWETGQLYDTAEEVAAANDGKLMWSPYTKNRLIQSWGMEDASFLRLASITLGYTIPEHLTKKIRIQRIRVYATGANLFCLTPYSGYDPEVDTRRSTPLTPNMDYSAFPKSRSWVFGLNISF